MKIKKIVKKPHVLRNKIKYWLGLYETFNRHYNKWPNSFWARKRDEAATELTKLGYTKF